MSTQIPLDALLGWMLVCVRLLALFAAAPVFGHTALPPRIRLGLALLVALGLPPLPEAGLAAADLAGLVLREGLIGLSLGFASQLVFAAFALLGEFVSMQGGLGAARVLDPQSGASSVALASALQAFALIVFLSLEAHHGLLRAAADSFERLPLGGAGPDPASLAGIAALGGGIYETAVRLALPVVVAMGVTNCGVGLLGRAIPQLNLMTVQLPAQVALLLLLLALGVQPFTDAASQVLEQWSSRSAAVALGLP